MKNTDEAKGRLKEAAGDLSDDKRLKREGKIDRTAGRAKDAIREVEDKAEDIVDALKVRVRDVSNRGR